MKMNDHHQNGFTLVELLIATTVFSTVLLVISFGLITAMKTYTKTINQTRTQETARQVIDQVSQAMQFGGSDFVAVTNGNGDTGFCIGSKRFTYAVNRQVTSSSGRGLYVDQPSSCTEAANISNPATMPTDGQELLAEGMYIKRFEISTVGTTNLRRVTIHVMLLPVGENPASSTLLNSTQDSCRIGAGGEFCATSLLETVIEKRI